MMAIKYNGIKGFINQGIDRIEDGVNWLAEYFNLKPEIPTPIDNSVSTTNTEVTPTANSGSNSIVAASNTEVAPTTTASTGNAIPKTDWDTWYSSNQATIERDRNQGLRDAYVNRELMNKYLTNNLYEAGLDRSGIAAEYLNQSNTAYMNNMAQVNKNAQDRQMDIYNTYFTGKREEEANRNATLLDMQKAVIENAVNSKGYLSNEDIEKIYSSPQYQELNDESKSNLDYYMNIYKGTEEQELATSQNEKVNEISKEIDNVGDGNYEGVLSNTQTAYNNGEVSKAQYDAIKQTISQAALNELDIEIGTILAKNQNDYGETGIYYDQAQNILNKVRELKNKGIIDENTELSITTKINSSTIKRNENPSDKKSEEEIVQEVKANTSEERKEDVDSILKNSYDNAKGMANELKSKYSIDYNNSINVDDPNINLSMFGDFQGSSEQNEYFRNIIDMARKGRFFDGDVIRFNYGARTIGNRGDYMYFGGRFYKIDYKFPMFNFSSISPTYASSENPDAWFSKDYTTPKRVKGGRNFLSIY